jgi:hypothetical protein
MAARRLFEHENDVHFYLLWILQTWMDSFEIWYAGLMVCIGFVIIKNKNRVKKSPSKIKNRKEFHNFFFF